MSAIATNGKKIVQWLYAALLLAGVVALITVTYAVCRWSRLLPPAQTIVVSGEGTSLIKPDIATISFAVISEGVNIAVLQNDNNQKINQAIAAVRSFKVADADIKTTHYNLSPRYRYDEKKRQSFIDGYQLSQTVTVTVRNLDVISSILGALPPLGINQLSGPNFGVEDADKYLNEARAEAFAKAKARARDLARLSGVTLGQIVTFSENAGSSPSLYMKTAEGIGGDGPVAPRIESGSEEVSVIVSITFEIR